MKKLFSLFTLLSLAASISFAQVQEAPAATETTDGPKMELASTTVDFGTIEQDSDPFRTITFTNTGNEPLIIKNAKGSCGCTVPQWPKEAIAPGESSEMLVEFNSKGKPGQQNKRVTITANTNPPQTYINIKGEVLKKEGAVTPTPVQ